MMIESNASVINMLDPLADTINRLDSEQGKSYRLPLDFEFSVLHTKSIARLYGEHGYEIIQLLHSSPATAVCFFNFSKNIFIYTFCAGSCCINKIERKGCGVEGDS